MLSELLSEPRPPAPPDEYGILPLLWACGSDHQLHPVTPQTIDDERAFTEAYHQRLVEFMCGEVCEHQGITWEECVKALQAHPSYSIEDVRCLERNRARGCMEVMAELERDPDCPYLPAECLISELKRDC